MVGAATLDLLTEQLGIGEGLEVFIFFIFCVCVCVCVSFGTEKHLKDLLNQLLFRWGK